MIEIFSRGNENFQKNGDITLKPSVCKVTAELNGAWELNIEHPIDDDGRWKKIIEGAVVAAPFMRSEKQLFRIYTKHKGDFLVTAKARPIFMDAAGEVFLMDVRPTDKSGADAAKTLTSGQSKYNLESNITKHGTAYYVRKNLIEAMQGNEDQAFINRWGGEVFYDNYTAYINERIGYDNGLKFKAGLNIKEIEEEIDMSGVVTRIVPLAYNGYMISGDAPWVDSKNIGKYPIIYTRTMEFSDVKMASDVSNENDDSIICKTQQELDEALIKKCKEQYAKECDLPICNYRCDIVDLKNVVDYEDVKGMESAGLGDTAEVENVALDIKTTGRVISITYDCITKSNENIEVGDFSYNYIKDMESALRKIETVTNGDGSLKAEKMSGVINAVKTMMRAQANAAEPAPVRATIFEDLVEGSPTYGALCLGTMGFQIANKRTADGKEWDWRTFGTGAGFFADLIVAGTMLADRIRAGKLRSQDYVEGKSGFELNLDTGVITFYGSDDSGNASKLLFEKGGITITNLATESIGKVSIRYQKVGDSYLPIIAGTDSEHGYSMNQNSLVYMMGTLIKASMGISEDKGYVNTDTLNIRESIMSGNRKGISQVIKCAGGQVEFINGICVGGKDGTSGLSGRAEFSDGSYMQFENGLFVGGYTTEGGGIG